MKKAYGLPLLAIVAILTFLPSCGKSNNSKKMSDLVEHLKTAGLRIEATEEKEANSVIPADEAVSLVIEGYDIALYKFNLDLPEQKAALNAWKKGRDALKKDGVTLIGEPTVLVNGSFMLLVDEKQPKCKEIKQAFLSF